ncbi:MAG: phosphonoacetaldehyde reductase, partial [Firmicutes bacterium]|nr:phosphonoacetaldehyde reductase [Bacillota bacterium]
YRRLKVGDLVAQYITAESDLAPLVPLMFTPGRADNNLREASPEHLRQIIEKSLTELGIK